MTIKIHQVDLDYLGLQGAIAAWAVEGPDGWVLVESGPESCWKTLQSGLGSLGVEPGDLKGVLLTHIHLDHAGGAWRLAELGVPVHVHERGARHLINPEKLLASATRIYGDDMDRLWGTLEACPEQLVHPASDGDKVTVAGLEFQAIETPGHARHHHAWSLEDSTPATVFTGDAAAMLIPDSTWISIPMPPPEMDLDAWNSTIDRLQAGHWSRLCLTHGGTVEGAHIPSHLETLRKGLHEQVDFIRSLKNRCADLESQRPIYRAWLLESALESGISETVFNQFVSIGLLNMNLSGVSRYIDLASSP
ncbi:MAG: MBL fold metallo-hydrolase [Phycisphaerales bacterium]|nr:MBL fold metallo-hydrolase [Phycisphaerales bacterium]|tara:strand:+ start:4776 stop:5693 length:918 start_codon:yes stop_codon:yes gene_type:complete